MLNFPKPPPKSSSSKPLPSAPTQSQPQISRSQSSSSHSPPSQHIKQLTDQNTRLKKFQQLLVKSLTIVKNGVEIINRPPKTTDRPSNSNLQPSSMTLDEKIQQLRKEFETILKRAEGCQQIIKFVAETLSENEYTPEFTKIKPTVSFRKLTEECKQCSQSVFSSEVMIESLREENEQLKKELKNAKKKSNGNLHSEQKPNQQSESKSIEFDLSKTQQLQVQNKQLTLELSELRNKLQQSIKQQQILKESLLKVSKPLIVDKQPQVQQPNTPQPNTPKKPSKLTSKHSKSQTKHTKICMPGIKGHFIALDHSSEENNSLDNSKIIKKLNEQVQTPQPREFQSSEASASKSQIESYIEEVEKLKRELQDRQKNFELLQSRYKDLESEKIEPPLKYVMDSDWGNDVEVEVVEIELPMNGADVCTKRRFLRKTIRRRSLSIARSIESKRFGVKTNNSNIQLETPFKNKNLQESPKCQKSNQNIFDIVRISEKSQQNDETPKRSQNQKQTIEIELELPKNFQKKGSKGELVKETRPNFFNRDSSRRE